MSRVRSPSPLRGWHEACDGDGASNTLRALVETWKTPTLDEIHILASCVEGKFSRITPIQWKSIGWAPVETMK